MPTFLFSLSRQRQRTNSKNSCGFVPKHRLAYFSGKLTAKGQAMRTYHQVSMSFFLCGLLLVTTNPGILHVLVVSQSIGMVQLLNQTEQRLMDLDQPRSRLVRVGLLPIMFTLSMTIITKTKKKKNKLLARMPSFAFA